VETVKNIYLIFRIPITATTSHRKCVSYLGPIAELKSPSELETVSSLPWLTNWYDEQFSFCVSSPQSGELVNYLRNSTSKSFLRRV
jgi:hypothetical protein